MLLVTLDPGSDRLDEETGAVATEYGLILVLVVLAMILAVTAFGISVSGLFDRGVEPF